MIHRQGTMITYLFTVDHSIESGGWALNTAGLIRDLWKVRSLFAGCRDDDHRVVHKVRRGIRGSILMAREARSDYSRRHGRNPFGR